MKAFALLLLCVAVCAARHHPAERICAREGSDGVLVAHEHCNKFYKCAHGVPVARHCYGFLVFNPRTDECDYPHKVDCTNRPIIEIEVEEKESEEDVKPCNCNPAEAPAICAAPESSGVLVAHETCNQYYICDHGAPVTMPCSNGLLWNAREQKCDWPEYVDCGNRPIVQIDNGGGNGGENGGTCNCNPSEAPEICAAEGSDGVLVAHEHCNWFYKCAHGVPVARHCYGFLVFNPYTEECDWPHKVDCSYRPIVEIDGGNGDEKDESEEHKTCNCNPAEAPAICAAPGSSGILVAHETCNQYYICDHGAPVAMPCSNGLLWNAQEEKCDWPEDVYCGNRPIVEIDNGGGNGGENEGTCNCNPAEAPRICAEEGSDGILVAHEHCSWFYKCAHGVPVVRHCYGFLLFNPYTNECDYPHNVNCDDRRP